VLKKQETAAAWLELPAGNCIVASCQSTQRTSNGQGTSPIVVLVLQVRCEEPGEYEGMEFLVDPDFR
jgi:hypothetical protein